MVSLKINRITNSVAVTLSEIDPRDVLELLNESALITLKASTETGDSFTIRNPYISSPIAKETGGQSLITYTFLINEDFEVKINSVNICSQSGRVYENIQATVIITTDKGTFKIVEDRPITIESCDSSCDRRQHRQERRKNRN